MTVREVWECYNDGEPVFDMNSNQTGIKPPLRLVEQQWKAEWQGGPTVELIVMFSIFSHAKRLWHLEPSSLVEAEGAP